VNKQATETDEQAADRIEGKMVPLRAEVIEAYDSMLASVPDAEGEGYERILEQIAAATNPADLDSPWRSGDLAELAGIPLVIRGIRKRPSDFGGGLPWFLIVDAVNEVTGEPLVVTTGAVSVVAQLTKAYALNAFPLRVRPVVAERPTSSGYYPQRLEILTQPKATQAADGGA
jgi:hypothetical protein